MAEKSQDVSACEMQTKSSKKPMNTDTHSNHQADATGGERKEREKERTGVKEGGTAGPTTEQNRLDRVHGFL